MPEVSGSQAENPVQEIDRLRSSVVQLGEAGTDDDPTREARALVREWTEVFGLTPDFAGPILKRANILAATCLVVGRRQLRESEFDVAIIDEAGRATAPEVLVPLVRARRVILVGDERQLPPLLDKELSPRSLAQAGVTAEGLERSLFETLVRAAERDAPKAVLMLTVQYRMHPAIGRLISAVFYEGKLTHGVGDAEREHGLTWVPRPVTWFSTSLLPRREEGRRGTSLENMEEINQVEHLLQRMEADYRATGQRREVGVIAAYAAQIAGLQARLEPENKDRWQALNVEVATVDGFQGRDRDIVIYSAVRSNRQGRIGFLADGRRLNVALSRARQLLLIVGDVVMLDHASDTRAGNPFLGVVSYIRSHPDDCAIDPLAEPTDGR